MNYSTLFEKNKIIAAVRDDASLEKVVRSSCAVVFVVHSDILQIQEICTYLKKHQKTVFLHMDMIEGLKGDERGIAYIKKNTCCDGIITTKHNYIKYAKQHQLASILRIFVIDSRSISTAIKNVKASSPTAIEIMPAFPKAIQTMKQSTGVPVIASGLVESMAEVESCLARGAVAVSTSVEKLWHEKSLL